MTERLLRENREANGGAVGGDGAGGVDGLDQTSGARGDFELPRLSCVGCAKGGRTAGNVGTRGHISSAPSVDLGPVDLLGNRFSNCLSCCRRCAVAALRELRRDCLRSCRAANDQRSS